VGRGEEPGGLAFWEFLRVTKDIFTLAASTYTATNYTTGCHIYAQDCILFFKRHGCTYT